MSVKKRFQHIMRAIEVDTIDALEIAMLISRIRAGRQAGRHVHRARIIRSGLGGAVNGPALRPLRRTQPRNGALRPPRIRHAGVLLRVVTAHAGVAGGSHAYSMKRLFSKRQRLLLAMKSGGKCEKLRGQAHKETYHADHVTPWSRGGNADTKRRGIVRQMQPNEKFAK